MGDRDSHHQHGAAKHAGRRALLLLQAELREGKLNFTMPHIGHSLGVELHETPMIRPGEKRKLEEGMVINIEPLITDSAGETYHLEDLFVVTGSGPRLLTQGFAPRSIPVIGEPISA
nr:M24 family metallopeptidase [Bradyrhizobium elkanii]